MDALSVLTRRSYRHQSAATLCECCKCVFFMEDKSNVIKDVNSAKMSDSFAIVEVLMVDQSYTTDHK